MYAREHGGTNSFQVFEAAEPCVLSHGSSPMEAAERGPGRQLWTGMRVSVTAYLLQGPPIMENRSQRIERIESCVCVTLVFSNVVLRERNRGRSHTSSKHESYFRDCCKRGRKMSVNICGAEMVCISVIHKLAHIMYLWVLNHA
jgi:hypothetical protein